MKCVFRVEFIVLMIVFPVNNTVVLFVFPELQELMGSLLYIRNGLENSPYAHLLDPVGWTEIADIFRRDACAMLGLSVDSPLSIV